MLTKLILYLGDGVQRLPVSENIGQLENDYHLEMPSGARLHGDLVNLRVWTAQVAYS